MISYDFSGKRFALIGVSKGLGFAVAYRLNEAKGEVVINARNRAKLDDIANQMPNRDLVKAVEGDAAQKEVLDKLRELGPYDGVVITIGGTSKTPSRTLKASTKCSRTTLRHL